jgi:menaquinone-dependent protoporphyrinogen IX oxidase
MKVLILYDTVSPLRVTEKVAETISEVLKEKGIEVDTLFVGNVDQATVKNYDCVIAGAPTVAFRASKGIMQFLDSFSDRVLWKAGSGF